MAQRVCPFWIGYLLASPVRKLLQDPAKILELYVGPNMTVLDLGAAMGFFTLPMARAVRPRGKVVSVDVQPKMLEALRRRAAKAELADRIETHACTPESIGLGDRGGVFDFALVFAMLHEVPDPARCLAELFELLKPGGRVLLAEPTAHVKQRDFDDSLALAKECGFLIGERPAIWRTQAAILMKPGR